MTIWKYLQILIILIGVIEMIFFSGIFYGMNSLFPSLYRNKMFYNVCDTSSGSMNVSRECQFKHYGNLFITGVISQSLLSIVCGIFVDKFGPLYTKLTTATVFLIGCGCFAASVRYWNFASYVAMILLGVSSQGMLLVDLPLGALFPRLQNLIVSIYSGCFDTSTLVFKLIAVLEAREVVGLHNSLVMLGFSGLVIVFGSTGLLYFVKYRPRRQNQNEDKSQHERLMDHEDLEKRLLQITTGNQILASICKIKFDIEEHKPAKEVTTNSGEKNEEKKPLNEEELLVEPKVVVVKNKAEIEDIVDLDSRYPNLQSIICSKLFLLHSFFFIIVFFRFTFFMAQISLQLKHQFPDQPDLVTELLSSSSLFFLFGVFLTPICGGIVDGTRSILRSRYLRPSEIAVRSFIVPLIICISFNCLVSVMIMVPSKLAVQFSFVFVTFTRAFLFSINSGMLLQVFPVKFFGRLMGLIVFVAGVISFLQYALLLLPSFLAVNYLLVALSILVYLYPVLLTIGYVF